MILKFFENLFLVILTQSRFIWQKTMISIYDGKIHKVWENRAKFLIGIWDSQPQNKFKQKVGIFSIHHQPVLVQWVISFNYLPCCRSALIFWVKDFWEFVQSVFAIFLQSDFLFFLQSDFLIFLTIWFSNFFYNLIF